MQEVKDMRNLAIFASGNELFSIITIVQAKYLITPFQYITHHLHRRNVPLSAHTISTLIQGYQIYKQAASRVSYLLLGERL